MRAINKIRSVPYFLLAKWGLGVSRVGYRMFQGGSWLSYSAEKKARRFSGE
jgi:hypothetical protein